MKEERVIGERGKGNYDGRRKRQEAIGEGRHRTEDRDRRPETGGRRQGEKEESVG
jgi:hypothetical protein